MSLQIKDPVLYAPLAMTGHCRAHVVAARDDGTVDIEIDPDDAGAGEALILTRISVVPTLRDLGPGTCTPRTP